MGNWPLIKYKTIKIAGIDMPAPERISQQVGGAAPQNSKKRLPIAICFGITMYDCAIGNLFLCCAWHVLNTVNMHRVPAGREYLGNLCISNLLPAYAGRKQLR